METNKAALTIDGEGTQINFASPFAKINESKRLVSGYATTNRVDSQKDIVTTEASLKAFQNARGNVREMHGPVAVGRVVDYKVDKYVGKDGNTYEGIYTTVYISKGAPEAWEKVLDGTYTGFSIGGNITDSDSEWRKDADGSVRIVKGFDLIELSIVDNPANQDSNIFSIQKNLTTEPVAPVKVENAFLCRTDEVARTSEADTLKCITCGEDMEPMGWVESAGDMNKSVKSLMQKFLTPDTNEGGVTKMTDENENKTVDSPEGDLGITDPEVVEAPSSEEVANETPAPETPAEPEEPTVSEDANTDEPDIQKMLAEVKGAVSKEVASLEEKINDMKKAADSRLSELDEKLGEAMQKFDSAKSELNSVAKRLGVVEGKSAIRKSADVETSVRSESSEPDDIWSGALLDRDLN